MSSSWWKGYFIGLCVGVFCCIMPRIMIPSADRVQAIERGFAEYNQQTGDWQWKEVKDVAVQK